VLVFMAGSSAKKHGIKRARDDSKAAVTSTSPAFTEVHEQYEGSTSHSSLLGFPRIEVPTHVGAINFSDPNYGHGQGQVFASDLPSIAGVCFSEGVCPHAVKKAFAGGQGICKNYSERLNKKGKPGGGGDAKQGANNGESSTPL
jgi:hypothetical protein